MIIVFLSGERSAFYLFVVYADDYIFLNQRIIRLIFIIGSLILVIILSYFYDPIKQRMFNKTHINYITRIRI